MNSKEFLESEMNLGADIKGRDIGKIFLKLPYNLSTQKKEIYIQWTIPLSDKILKKIEIGKNITIA